MRLWRGSHGDPTGTGRTTRRLAIAPARCRLGHVPLGQYRETDVRHHRGHRCCRRPEARIRGDDESAHLGIRAHDRPAEGSDRFPELLRRHRGALRDDEPHRARDGTGHALRVRGEGKAQQHEPDDRSRASPVGYACLLSHHGMDPPRAATREKSPHVVNGRRERGQSLARATYDSGRGQVPPESCSTCRPATAGSSRSFVTSATHRALKAAAICNASGVRSLAWTARS